MCQSDPEEEVRDIRTPSHSQVRSYYFSSFSLNIQKNKTVIRMTKKTRQNSLRTVKEKKVYASGNKPAHRFKKVSSSVFQAKTPMTQVAVKKKTKKLDIN